MDQDIRENILIHIHEAHSLVEKAYLQHPSAKGDPEWLQKKRLLLADLSLHMAQTGVQEVEDVERIKRYLYSILTICQDFMPEVDLTTTAEKLIVINPQ